MAQAKNNGRKREGRGHGRKVHEVRPDGAHAYCWAYQARMADALAAQRDQQRSAQAQADAAQAEEQARTAIALAQAAAQAKRQAQLAPRPCLRCLAVLPPEAFEPHHRAYNGRMGCCRPCAKLIRDRKAAPTHRRTRVLSPRPCRGCERLWTPRHGKCVYCSEECRRRCQKDAANARRRADYQTRPESYRQAARAWSQANPEKCRAYRRRAYQARPEAEKAAHAAWAARNRERVNAYMRGWRRQAVQQKTWHLQTNAAARQRRQRRQAINAAKADWAGTEFLLLRSRSGFWRGTSAGQAIGRTETVMARYEWSGGAQWCVRPPAIATETVRQVAARLRQGEERMRRGKKGIAL